MILFMIVIVILLLILWGLYTFVFCHPYKKRPNPYNIPSGPLYKDHKDTMLTMIENMDSTPYVPMTIRSFDGCRLYGRMYQNSPNAPTIIFFHGYHGTSAWDGYGLYRIAHKHGLNILMADTRAHGQSGGHISFGIKERYDCKFWAEYIIKLFGPDTSIFLAGVSMGAASVLLASSLELPVNVKGLISDCSFSKQSAILKNSIQQMGLPAFPFYPLVRLSAHLFGHFNLEEITPVDAAKNMTLPVIFLHGSKDSIVPLQMCDSLYESCTAPKKKIIVEGADHANSALVNYPLYESAVWDFMSSLL